MQKLETRMKRLVLLILVLLLVINLGEDGCLGKVMFVAPASSAKTSLTSPLLDCSWEADSRYTLPSDGGEISRLLQFRTLKLIAQPTLKIIIYTNTSSSGGIPR